MGECTFYNFTSYRDLEEAYGKDYALAKWREKFGTMPYDGDLMYMLGSVVSHVSGGKNDVIKRVGRHDYATVGDDI